MGDPTSQPPPAPDSGETPSGTVAAASSGPKWGAWGGWGSSAFSVISGIQKAAAEAADELTKNAIAVAKDAAKGVAELQENVTNSLQLPAEDENEANSTEEHENKEEESDSPDSKLRAATLQKFEEAGDDTALGHSLKVIDASVENLASGAWQAFGTAWRGSRSFIQKLEHSAENIAESLQKQSLAPTLLEGGKAITAKGLEVLEYVGKEAIDLIASEAGIQIEDESKPSDGETIEEDERYMDDATFDRCFYIYGGPEQLEELEALSNHHMLLCNRVKAKLSSDQKLSFDSILKQIQQIMDLGIGASDKPADADKGKRVETGLVGDSSELKVIRETSVAKAAEMATGFTVALNGLAVTEIVHKTTDRLEAIKVEGVHRLSELCASGISQLLNVGKSILSIGSEQEEGQYAMTWPEDCLEKAKLIRAQAQSMAGDIEAISDSFVTGIGDVTAAYQTAIKNDTAKDAQNNDIKHDVMKGSPIEEKARKLTGDLEGDGSGAIEKVQSGLKQLVYVVLYSAVRNWVAS